MATAGPAQQRAATYADLEAAPDHLVAEILFGSLVTHPRPARRLKSYVLRDGQWTLHETFDGADEVKAPPFDAVPFPISALWPLDPAPVQS